MYAKIAGVCMAAIAIAVGIFVYDLATRGHLEREAIYVNILDLGTSRVFQILGRPRSLDDNGEFLKIARWDGREVESWNNNWTYEVWFIGDTATDIAIREYKYFVDIERMKDVFGEGREWQLGKVLKLGENDTEAWLTMDRSIAIYADRETLRIASNKSSLWE